MGAHNHRDEVLDITHSLYPKKYRQKAGETVPEFNQRFMQDLALVRTCHPTMYPPEERICATFVDALLSHSLRREIRYDGENEDKTKKLQTSFPVM